MNLSGDTQKSLVPWRIKKQKHLANRGCISLHQTFLTPDNPQMVCVTVTASRDWPNTVPLTWPLNKRLISVSNAKTMSWSFMVRVRIREESRSGPEKDIKRGSKVKNRDKGMSRQTSPIQPQGRMSLQQQASQLLNLTNQLCGSWTMSTVCSYWYIHNAIQKLYSSAGQHVWATMHTHVSLNVFLS